MSFRSNPAGVQVRVPAAQYVLHYSSLQLTFLWETHSCMATRLFSTKRFKSAMADFRSNFYHSNLQMGGEGSRVTQRKIYFPYILQLRDKPGMFMLWSGQSYGIFGLQVEKRVFIYLFIFLHKIAVRSFEGLQFKYNYLIYISIDTVG